MADQGFDLSSAQDAPEEAPQASGDFDLGSAKEVPEFEDTSDLYKPPTRAEQFTQGLYDTFNPLNTPAAGLMEAGLHFGSGTAAFLLKGLRSAWNLATEKPGQKVNEAVKAMNATDAMVYEPRGPYGQLFGKAVDAGSSWPGMLADKAGMKVYEKTGSPGWGAATSWGLQALPVVLGAKYASTKAGAAPGLSEAGAEAAARTHVGNMFGIDFDALSANVQNKLKTLAKTGSDFSNLSADALARQSRLDKLKIPYTRGDITRDAAQVTREETLSKAEEAGKGVRDVRAAQDEALHNNLASLRGETGSLAQTREGLGISVQDLALRKKEAVSRANYQSLYKTARATEPETTVSAQPMADLLSANPEIQHMGFVKTWLNKAGLKVGEDGAIEGNPGIRLDQLDDLRKKAVAIAKGGGTDGYYAGEAIKAIDQAFEGVPNAAAAWKAARDAFKAHKTEFEDTGAVQKQVGMKSRVDRTTALADTFDRFIGGSSDDIRNIKNSLLKGGSPETQAAGLQAWKDLQGATLDYLKDKAVGKRGIEGDASTEAGARAFEAGKKLEQFNSTFRDAYSELKKDGKIGAIFSPEQVAKLDELYSAVGDVRTRPPARISGSPTAANATAMLEDFAKKEGLNTVVSKIPVAGGPLSAYLRWRSMRKQTARDIKQAAQSPLDEQASRAETQAHRQRVWGRIFRYGAPTVVGGGEEGPPRPAFARGGVVQHFSTGGQAIKGAVKKLAETLDEIKARRDLEQQQAKAPIPGQFSTLDKVIESAPSSLTLPEQWMGYFNNRAFQREGVNFPLKKEELDFTGMNKLLQTLKDRQALAPEEFKLSSEAPVQTPLQEATAGFHQALRDRGLGHYENLNDFNEAWLHDRPHPQTGHVLNAADIDALEPHTTKLNEARTAVEDAGPPDIFSGPALGKLGPKSVQKEDLLTWLRAHRPAITSTPSTEYSGHIANYLQGNGNGYMADLTGIPAHWDPEVPAEIERYGGHFYPRPLSWSRSARSLNAAGQSGRTIHEIQSDVHQKAGDKVLVPAPERLQWLQEQMTDPRLNEDDRARLQGWPGTTEDILRTGSDVPQGFSTRPRGYGPLAATQNPPPGTVAPLYDMLPYKKLEGHAPAEIRKQMARAANEGSDWLSVVSGPDQGQSGARAAAMGKVYGTGPEPENLGIYPTMLQKLARQYNVPFDPAHPIALKPEERHRGADQPIALRAQTPYQPGRTVRGRPYALGEHVRDQLSALQTQLDAAAPAGEAWTLRQKIRSNEALRNATHQMSSTIQVLGRNMRDDISDAYNAGLIDWGKSHQARELYSSIYKIADKMTNYDPKLPGPSTLRQRLNELESLHNEVRPLVDAHNQRLAAGAPAVREEIKRPAMIMDPETRARIQRIGVPLFTAAGAGLGLNAMQNPDQQDQGFARGGVVYMSAGGEATKQAVKQLSMTLEEIQKRRVAERNAAQAPQGMFSTLDQLIQQAPKSVTTPEQWMGYLKPGREFKREGVAFPLKQEELDFTGINRALQSLKDRKANPAAVAPPIELTPYQKALKEFHDWASANNIPASDGPAELYQHVSNGRARYTHNNEVIPNDSSWGGLWDPFVAHYHNIEREKQAATRSGKGLAPPVDPFNADKLGEHNLTPDKVQAADLLAWLRKNRPTVTSLDRSEYGDNRPSWMRNTMPQSPYNEDLTQIQNHWDPNVLDQIKRNTGHFRGDSPLSWARTSQTTSPSGDVGRMISEIQSDIHGKAGNRVATPPPELTQWAQENIARPELPQDIKDAISSAASLREHELGTGQPPPQGMGERRIGYGTMDEINARNSTKVPPMYKGVPFQKVEGFGPLEIRKQLARAADAGDNFLGMVSGADQNDIYNGGLGSQLHGMNAVYGAPGAPGIYQRQLEKLAKQYNLPYSTEHEVGKPAPPAQSDLIRVQQQGTYDPADLRQRMGAAEDHPVTLGSHMTQAAEEFKRALGLAEGQVPSSDQLNANPEAWDTFGSNTGSLARKYYRTVSHVHDYGLVPNEMYERASTLASLLRKEIDKLHERTPVMPDMEKVRAMADELEGLQSTALAKVKEHNDSMMPPADAPPIKRPAIILSPEARERIRRIGVPLFSAAAAAAGINQMSNPEDQGLGFKKGGLAQAKAARFATGGVAGPAAAKAMVALARMVNNEDRPGVARRLWAQVSAGPKAVDAYGDTTLLGVPADADRWRDPTMHARALADPRAYSAYAMMDHPNDSLPKNETSLKYLEDFGGVPASMSGIGDLVTGGNVTTTLADLPGGLPALRWSKDRFDKGQRVVEQNMREQGVPQPSNIWERAQDATGNMLGQIPTPWSALRFVKGLDKLVDFNSALKYLPKSARVALTPAAWMADYFGPTVVPKLKNYAGGSLMGILAGEGLGALERGQELNSAKKEDDQTSADPEAAAGRSLDDLREMVTRMAHRLHHVPLPGHAQGGLVNPVTGEEGGSSGLAEGVSNILQLAGKLGRQADKAYPTISKHLKSPLTPKPQPKSAS